MVNYAPDTTSRATDWRDDALCREEDPDLFFPIGNTGDAILQTDQAKAVCRRCPVMEQCLQWALETGQDAGVWGGLGEDERRLMKRRAARNKPPKPEPVPEPAPEPEPQIVNGKELAPCGTTAAYRRHTRRGEPIDRACRIAHNAANRRLQNTGTTKVPA